MRDVGDDLQRVPVAADLVAVELGLHARLVDEILRRAAAEDDRRRAGRRMIRFADSTMSPMMSMWPAPAFFWRACDRPMPIDESAMAGQKIGTLAR